MSTVLRVAAACVLLEAAAAGRLSSNFAAGGPQVYEEHYHGRRLPQCFDHITWTVSNGDILLNGQPFRVRGANWFGFETGTSVVHGLWGATTMDAVLDMLVTNKLNVLRIPFSLDMALNSATTIPAWNCYECVTNKSWDALDRLFDKAAAKGIMIILELHSFTAGGPVTELWYNGSYSEANVIAGWSNMLNRWGSRANLMGIDIKNEPHGAATWNKNAASTPIAQQTDWDKAAVRIVTQLKTLYPSFDKLIIVEGVGTGGADSPFPGSDPAYNKWNGSNLDGVYTAPLDFGVAALNNRLVYSSLIWGPSVNWMPYFGDATFPANMPGVWDKQVGFVENVTGKPLLISGWGGMKNNVAADMQLQSKWVQYMAANCIGDSIIWAINPNSGSTQGLLLDGWTSPNTAMLDLTKIAQPDPAVITSTITNTNICVTFGAQCVSTGTPVPTATPVTAKPTVVGETAVPTAVPTGKPVVPTPGPTATPGSQCYNHLTWTVGNGEILLNGQPFRVRGANWFGFETGTSIVHGLWGSTTMDYILDLLVTHNFNVLRIPFSNEFALNPGILVPGYNCYECVPVPSDTYSAWSAMDRLFDKAAARGIMIILDMHNFDKGGPITDLWYDSSHSEASFINGWAAIIGKWGSRANLMGIDFKNEPHGAATWNRNAASTPISSQTDWDKAVVRVANELKNRYPSFDKLMIVEGMGTGGADAPYPTSDPAYNKFWGSNLDGLYSAPLDFGSAALNNRLVYSSHMYGPSVSWMSYFSDASFPDNMPAIWDKQVGFVEAATGKPVLVGEWGGLKNNAAADEQLQNKWVRYMAANCIGDSIVWAVNPNSGDTQGLVLDDWTTPNTKLLDLAKIAQPTPSRVTSPITSTNVCLIPVASSTCGTGGTSPPSATPSAAPTAKPVTANPTGAPTAKPVTAAPTATPSAKPVTAAPTAVPTAKPSANPTAVPTSTPTVATANPTANPTATPSAKPVTPVPTAKPTSTRAPTAKPTRAPTRVPTAKPTKAPTAKPTVKPTTAKPTKAPTAKPTVKPTAAKPTKAPTAKPTVKPTTAKPTKAPTAKPTVRPTTAKPTAKPV